MEKKSLSQQTADRLYTMIVVEHRLSPGEKLPSEVELARELGVSRTTLREALHVLVSQKILEARRGRGTFVTDQAAQVNDYGFSHLDQVRGELKDLFELRAIFEPSAARLACLRATEEEMADILARGEDVDRCIRLGQDRTEADREFHAAIVRATHNSFMMRLLPHDQPGGGRRHCLWPAQGPAGGGHPQGPCPADGLLPKARRRRRRACHGHSHAPLH